jgi:hypothetical protein
MLITRIPSPDPVIAIAQRAQRAATYTMPTIAELVAHATADGDFFNDVTPSCDALSVAADYADIGAERWEDEHDEMPGTVAPDLILAARAVLLNLVNDLLHRAECDAIDALADAIQAGDADRDGNTTPYPTYRGAE